MCDKLPYCNPRIDVCLKDIIKTMNNIQYKTLASCCGHEKYYATIVIKNKATGYISELYTGKKLGVRKRNRYYKKDSEGFYYIPELKNEITND